MGIFLRESKIFVLKAEKNEDKDSLENVYYNKH